MSSNIASTAPRIPDAVPPPPSAGAPDQPHARRHAAGGVAYAVAAYLAWGFAPVYFKAVKAVPPDEVLAHRVLWSLPLLLAILWFGRGFRPLFAAFRSRRAMRTLAITTCLIGTNWFLYIWAVANGRVLQASLGYYINPLVTFALGVFFLKEPLTRARMLALLLAGAGVIYLAMNNGGGLWLSLTLAFSFAFYSLLRKRTHIDAVTGQAVETLLLTPLAIGYAIWLALAGRAQFPADSAAVNWLLPFAGVVTTVPLLWYTMGARRVSLATMGFLQYIAPTGQFILAVAAYGESFTRAHAVAFICIWAGLAVYALETARLFRRAR